MYVPEGPLSPRPERSGKGGTSINQGAAPPPVTSVWSAADAAANGMTLSNGGLTVTPSGDGTFASVRGTVAKSSGKAYVEFKVTGSISDTTHVVIGIASAGVNIGSSIGNSNYSGGARFTVANYLSAGFTDGRPANVPIVTNDVIGIAIDFASGKLWIFHNNASTVGGDPTTGTTPNFSFAPATVGPLFPALSFIANPGVWTLQATAASQKYAPPSGFSAWDGGVAPPPTSVWSASDAAATSMVLSNGGLTVVSGPNNANWQTIRTTVSKSSGKLYVEFLATAAMTAPYVEIGLANNTFSSNQGLGSAIYSGALGFDGSNLVSAGFTSNYNITQQNANANDVWAMAVDFTAGTVWFSKNNVWVNSSNPATASLPMLSFVPATVGALFAGMSH